MKTPETPLAGHVTGVLYAPSKYVLPSMRKWSLVVTEGTVHGQRFHTMREAKAWAVENGVTITEVRKTD